jgi:hypothetical protein
MREQDAPRGQQRVTSYEIGRDGKQRRKRDKKLHIKPECERRPAG